MTEVNRKIHVIGINSYKFEDLSFKLQNLFLETENIAVPKSYFEGIKLFEYFIKLSYDCSSYKSRIIV